MNKLRPFLIGSFLAVLTLASAEEWSSRLAEPDSAKVASDASRLRQTPALLRTLGSADEPTLERFLPFVLDCLPGGRRADQLTAEDRTSAMILAVKSKSQRPRVFFHLARIQEVGGEEQRAAAEKAMKSLPADEWPPGFEKYLADTPKPPDPALMAKGKEVFNRPAICVTCHQANGQGLPGAFPPLVGSPWLKGEPDRAIKIVLKGMVGPVKVGDQEFNAAMVPLESMLKDDEIAAVLTYVRNEWGNRESEVTTEQVAKIRAELKDASLWNSEDILKLHPLP